MLRKMCKECASRNFSIYLDKKLTGEMVKREVKTGRTRTIIRCKACGHEWSYTRKNSKK